MIYVECREPRCPLPLPTRPTQCRALSLPHPLICSLSPPLMTFLHSPCLVSPSRYHPQLGSGLRSAVDLQYNNFTLHVALVLVPTTRLCDLQCQRAYTALARSSYLSRQLWATYDSEQSKHRCEAVPLRTRCVHRAELSGLDDTARCFSVSTIGPCKSSVVL